MKVIKVKTPAKINLTLEVLNKREDGFHNIQSIMQTISLYDFLIIQVENFDGISIELSGNSAEIPYDESNLIYKAAIKFLEKSGIKNSRIKIFIEKNIPVAAGLAGGSSNAAGTFYGLNLLYDNILSDEQLNELCASLGSDLNFCLKGGCALCTSRGEIIEPLPSVDLDLSLIKPNAFGISAKEAYTKFATLKDRSNPDNTNKMKKLISKNKFDKKLLYNSLEMAVINDYNDLLEIKSKIKDSMMSGSGPTFFVLEPKINADFDKDKFKIIENLKTVPNGVMVVD